MKVLTVSLYTPITPRSLKTPHYINRQMGSTLYNSIASRIERFNGCMHLPLQVARLLERDSRKYKATVEVVYSSKVLTVDYDNICEYTGIVDD